MKIEAIEFSVRDIFIRSFVELFGDYVRYLSFIDEVPLFNTESFLKNRPEKDSKFYDELVQTQIFRQFLQNDAKETYPYFYRLTLRYTGSKIRNSNRSNSVTGRKSTLRSFSQNKIQNTNNSGIIKTLLNNEKNDNNGKSQNTLNIIDNKSSDSIESLVLKPYFIKNNINITNEKQILEIVESLYKTNNNMNTSFINNKRIFNNIKNFSFEKITSKCHRYLIPGSKELEKKKSRMSSKMNILQVKSTNNTNELTSNSNNLAVIQNKEIVLIDGLILDKKVNPLIQEINKKLENQQNDLQYREKRKLTFISKARQKKEEDLYYKLYIKPIDHKTSKNKLKV